MQGHSDGPDSTAVDLHRFMSTLPRPKKTFSQRFEILMN